MIHGFLAALDAISKTKDIRILVIRGKGSTFCAGGDLNWMLKSRELSDAENLKECQALAECFYRLYHYRAVTICLVHGSSLGGANGLVCACDISISEENAIFGFTEVRIGLLPATIAPYVIQRIGQSAALELMLSGRRINAVEAKKLGLIHQTADPGNSEEFLKQVIDDVLLGSPGVQQQMKESLFNRGKPSVGESVINDTAALLAQARTSADAIKGIHAFMQKRKPEWDDD
jgi:methylglutaconyl-CoA hydratase